ncbi:transposase [bacterium (Candidatus Gribaldobacteria) CG08_land_8_20_14_0_20_39_15]|uniref:Transposase n=1 Tax=bacterium (Candidatus Gribaldobacteria) CG08_land_8_20_14_0_20_39_15 TaxID=2014273 RepID=A0A2M6XUQ5_9BACT|nr:MAG: transposase [bacterium (Candidatus Gribaldobacteria) CG08_land_8_20_14_0_20_39_15]
MDMLSGNQYLKELRKEYLKIKSKKARGRLLDEAEKRTGLCRKYLVAKLKPKSSLDKSPQERKQRQRKYDGAVKSALVVCWRLFDRPCGERLKPLLEQETDRLRKLDELTCSNETARKLKEVSTKTIDNILRHQKEVERLNNKYKHKDNPLLYQIIPVKTPDEWDRDKLGNTQIDLVEHCGQSAAGEFLNTLSSTDIATGWWEGEVILGRGQLNTISGLDRAKSRFPFPWSGIHPDNGTEFLNYHLFGYCQEQGLEFTRSRPYKKNDNCFVEQKNKTHVKRFVGWLRYDTAKEQRLLNDLYRNELRLFKNFFQPQIKLKEKIRIQGKIHRKHQKAKTPYQRVMESKSVPEKTKQKLKEIYDNLNPAELKRAIDKKLDLLVEAYKSKNNSSKVALDKTLKPFSVRKYITEPDLVSVR